MSNKDVRWDLIIKKVAVAAVVALILLTLAALPLILESTHAAWAQFYGAMLAIVGAAAFPYMHKSNERSQRAESYRRLLFLLAAQQAGQLRTLISVLEDGPGSLGASIQAYLQKGEHLKWQPHVEALRAVPIVELSPLHVMSLSDLKVGAIFVESLITRLPEWNVLGIREIDDGERLRHFKQWAEITSESLDVPAG